MANAIVYVGAIAPEAYVLNVTPGDSGVDLSTVTAATFYVRDVDGTDTTWNATRSNQTADTLTLTHTFVSGDVDEPGDIVIYAKLTIPSGTVRTVPTTLVARGNFDPS